jgi:chromosome segregation ATPase
VSPKRRKTEDAPPPEDAVVTLPRGRMPAIGMREIVASLHRRRERRRESAAELAHAIQKLSASVEEHLARIASVRAAIEAQGGDLAPLQHYDTVMARLRAELRSAERSLASAFSEAARG